jgi:asparagine synthase (glutamine-hydrolysing)
MWSFAIFDSKDRTLFCSRDRFGQKPFNYAVVGGHFCFASEIKALLAYAPALKSPDYTSISNYCHHSVGAQHPETWFADVRRLQPGHNLTIRNGIISIERYWRYPADRFLSIDEQEARDEYRRLFQDAVNVRMRTDVPLGVALSAGLDSSSIAYTMQQLDPRPHHCFTSRFSPNDELVEDRAIYTNGGAAIDESVSAQRIASELGLQAHVVTTDYTDVLSELSQILWHLESGNSSPAVMPLMQLLRNARSYVTVILDGQGADELLGGYVAHLILQECVELIMQGRPVEALASLREFRRTYTLYHSVLMTARNASNHSPTLALLFGRLSGAEAALGPLLRRRPQMADYPTLHDLNGPDRVGQVLRQQHSGGLVNLLHYGDAISMANSMEARMPFLDHNLVEFVWRLPSRLKINLGIGKHIHRESIRGMVPDWIRTNTKKYGFSTPIGAQFRKEPAGKCEVIQELLSARCLDRGLFDRRGLKRLLELHRSGRRDCGNILFRFLSTELWFQRFIDT